MYFDKLKPQRLIVVVH